MFKVFILIFAIMFLTLGLFLDVTEKEQKSDIIISLGGSDLSRISTSVKLLQDGYSTKNKIIYFGKKNRLFWHIRKNHELKSNLENIDDFILYKKGMKNTMDEIRYIESLLVINSYSSVIIVTSPSHSRRVDFLIKQFTSELTGKYTIVSSSPEWWNKNLYFLNLKALKVSLFEIIKLIYNYFKYSFFEDTSIIEPLDNLSKDIKSYLYRKYNI